MDREFITNLGVVLEINPTSITKQYPYDEIEYIDISSVGTGFFSGSTHMLLAEAPSRAKRLVEHGDTIIAMVRPNLRSFLYIKNPPKNMVVSTGFAVLRPNNKINSRFLYYTVTNQKFTDYLSANVRGAAYPAVDTETFARAKIWLPDLPVQEKIASILSTYDDLIENNTRRIKILEEMAKTIYEEWFVKFRFPGHEKVKMIESELGMIPEGWRIVELSQVSRVVDCLHSKKPSEVTTPDEQYGFLLHIWNIKGEGRLDLSKKYFINEKDYRMWTRNIEVVEGDCVITNVGRVGDFAQIPRGVKAAIGRNMTAIRPIKEGVSPTFLIEYLRSPFMDKERAAKVDRGTIMDSLNVKGIVKLLIPMPPKGLMERFENFAYPLRLQAQILQEKIDNLRKTRDLLLPKLISGEIYVENLDIQAGDLNEPDV